ncbi:peptidase family protein [Mycolicibacterium chubuense NBB4]|uniref:Peptidase family protein n=1 Tax=Mycolicibacterium chubuense (strain NBB4) TaxID=710421 RepID=I4BNJ9_MYCCN|nr:M20/M25/M40 family metallo-hydrolase [Mycolicibacterium chubuense]AFM18856.1 peptidase family protein [Mycolicibacterium chubuense NBB4]
MAEERSTLRRELLQELLWAYGPGGQEESVRDICRRELEPCVDETWVDKAGNLVGFLRGSGSGSQEAKTYDDARGTRVLAHMDELSMIVKRVEPDGTLHVTPSGVMYPANFGLGPVAILGDNVTLTGVLSLGSEHTTKESLRIWQTKPDKGDKSLDWVHVFVFTGCTPEELAAAGVHPGTRVCVERSKRTLVDVGDYIGSYFMDDRASVTALLHAAQVLQSRSQRPSDDVYFVFTTNEEIGGVGASYASRTLPGDLTIALEVGPTEAEYDTTVGGGPIVAYSDSRCVYDKAVADRLMDIATELDLSPQAAVLGAFESDASHAKASGLSPRAGLLCVQTLSTHGYEVIPSSGIAALTDVVVEFLLNPA